MITASCFGGLTSNIWDKVRPVFPFLFSLLTVILLTKPDPFFPLAHFKTLLGLGLTHFYYFCDCATFSLWILIWYPECFAHSLNNSHFEWNPMSWWIHGAISFFSNSSRDNEPYHNMEERLLNLTTQPGFKLLSDDPYKSAIVAQRRCSKSYPSLENSLWRNMLRARREAVFFGMGVAWADTVTLPNLFWSQQRDAVQWDSTASLSLRVGSLSTSWTICPAVLGCEPIDKYLNLFPVLVRSTHQGAVVQESRGEVTAEAEWQDVSFSGAESHLVFWKGQEDSSDKRDKSTEAEMVAWSAKPVAHRQARSIKWF